MNQTATGLQKGQKHLFVHAVRFWSMLAIVALHSFLIYDLQARSVGFRPSFTLECGLQVFKFATIGFFLISGFLMGERLPQYGALKYFKRRLQNVGTPWLFWFSICVVTTVLRTTMVQGYGWRALTGQSWGLLNQVYLALNYTAFWFVPNLLLALACLLILRRWIDSLWVGVLFGSFTALYCVNIYQGWFQSRHTSALLGFVFFLWLGAWASRHYQKFKAWLETVPASVLITGVLVTFALSLWEAHILLPKCPEPLDEFNTLRPSNILFSVAVTLAVMRIPRRSWPKFINPEASTYGIYLAHSLMISIISGARRFMHLREPHSGVGFYANCLATFLAAYGMSLATVHLMALTRATRALVGIRAPEPKPHVAEPLPAFNQAGAGSAPNIFA